MCQKMWTCQPLKTDILALDIVQAITQSNVWTTDGREKFAMLHICPRDMAQSLTSKEDLRRLAKSHGYQVLVLLPFGGNGLTL